MCVCVCVCVCVCSKMGGGLILIRTIKIDQDRIED